MNIINKSFAEFPPTLLGYANRLNTFSIKCKNGFDTDMDILEESATFFVMHHMMADIRKGRYRPLIMQAASAWLAFCETVDVYGANMVILGNSIYEAIIKLIKVFNKEYDKGTLTNADYTNAKTAACKFMLAVGDANARQSLGRPAWPVGHRA